MTELANLSVQVPLVLVVEASRFQNACGGRTETLIVLSTSLPVLVADFGRREGC